MLLKIVVKKLNNNYKMILRKNFIKITILLMPFIFINCENVGNCNNTNPIFDKYNPDSDEYKKELIKKLRLLGIENATYYITGCGHNKEYDTEYLSVRVEGKELCAYADINIYKKDKHITSIFETEAFGYRGSEIEGLKLEISKDSTRPEFIYHGMKRIID
jgi:hypothetical protein